MRFASAAALAVCAALGVACEPPPTPTPRPYTGEWSYTVVGACTGSMEPTITCEDVVYIHEPGPGHSYAVGDIVSFHNPCPMTATMTKAIHRIDGIRHSADGPTYFTKGDNNDRRDDCAISDAQIIGLVVYVDKGAAK